MEDRPSSSDKLMVDEKPLVGPLPLDLFPGYDTPEPYDIIMIKERRSNVHEEPTLPTDGTQSLLITPGSEVADLARPTRKKEPFDNLCAFVTDVVGYDQKQGRKAFLAFSK